MALCALFSLISLCSEWYIVQNKLVCPSGECAKLINPSDQSVWSAWLWRWSYFLAERVAVNMVFKRKGWVAALSFCLCRWSVQLMVSHNKICSVSHLLCLAKWKWPLIWCVVARKHFQGFFVIIIQQSVQCPTKTFFFFWRNLKERHTC